MREVLSLSDVPGRSKEIYTTNVVENINSEVDLMRLELGGYFPSRSQR